MYMRPEVPVLLGKAEVYYVYDALLVPGANKEIVWFDVTMNEASRVNVFQALNELISDHKDCLEGELSGTEVENILKTRTEQIQYEDIEIPSSPIPLYIGNALNSLLGGQNAIESIFIRQLGVASFDTFKLDRNFLVCNYIDTEVDVTERAMTNLLAKFVQIPDKH